MKLPIFISSGSAFAAAALHAVPPTAHDTVIHQLPDHRVIIERAPGIILPDPPVPVVSPEPEPVSTVRLAELAAQWREYRETHPFIHAGATIYRLPDGSVISHVNQWSVNNGSRFSFWSRADFSLLAHPGNFVTSDGITYQMLLFHTIYDVQQWEAIHSKRGIVFKIPDLPEPSSIPNVWIPDPADDRNQKLDQETLAAVEAIHAHYFANLKQLKSDYDRREAENAARRSELETNPPKPRDIHLRVSRLDPAQAAAWHQYATESKGGDE
jgi:hypothetical protein